MNRITKYFWGLCILVLFGSIVLFWYICGGLDTALGAEKNKFESVSALFSGLAFAGMLVTLLLQRQELIDNRKEFKRTADANENVIRAAYIQEKLKILNMYIERINNEKTYPQHLASAHKHYLEEKQAFIEELKRLSEHPDK